MRTATMEVLGGLVDENIPAHEPPRRDEPSLTKPQRSASFWFRSIIYENKWMPVPELIPAALRFSRTGQNLRTPRTDQRQPVSSGGMIQRVIPSSYSAQVIGK